MNTVTKTGNALLLGSLAMFGWAMPAAALEDDQVRGEIVEVMPDQNQLQLRVEEVGGNRDAQPGDVATYEVDDDTRIHLEDASESILTPLYLRLDDLEPGTTVLLDLEDADGRLVARNVGLNEDDAEAARQRAEQRMAASGGSGSGSSSSDSDSTQQTDLAAAETSRRDRLPDTASINPLLALWGLGFAAAALVIRRKRRS